MTWPAFFWPHTVKVRRLIGSGGRGDRHEPEPGSTLRCEVKDEAQLIVDASGQEVTSNSQVTVPLSADVPLKSIVTVWPGTSAEREAFVLRIRRDENRGSPLDSFQVLYLG